MKPYSYLLLIAAWALFSCEETETPSYPTAYSKTEISPSGSFRLFTVNGEITRAQIIQRFMTLDTARFHQLARAEAPNAINQILFKNSRQAIIVMAYSTIECTVESSSTMYVLKRPDTTRAGSYGKQMTRSYSYLLAAVKPEVFSEYVASSTGGNYSFGYSTRQTFILNGNSAMYSLPIVVYAANHWSENYGPYFESGYINNNLQGDFYKKLSAEDTVAVMEYVIWYEKE